MRTLMKFGYDWRKISHKSKCKKDSESTYPFFIKFISLANYDRLGLDEEYIEFLGNKVVCYSIPIRPGRNLAVIVESAAINYRAKKMGYNAAQELYNRVTGSLSTNKEEQKEQ